MTSAGDRFEAKVCVEQVIKDDSFLDEFVCKICLVHVVGCGPKLTKCTHLFCGDCLEQWFAQHPTNQTWAQRAKMGGAVPCPVCKDLLKKDDIYAVDKNGSGSSPLLWSMIQSLEVRCSGQHGCTGAQCCWVGKYGDFWAHVQDDICFDVPPAEIEVETNDALKSRTATEDTSCPSPLSGPTEMALSEVAELSAGDSTTEVETSGSERAFVRKAVRGEEGKCSKCPTDVSSTASPKKHNKIRSARAQVSA